MGRDTFAEVPLTRLNDISEGDGIWGQIGVGSRTPQASSNKRAR